LLTQHSILNRELILLKNQNEIYRNSSNYKNVRIDNLNELFKEDIATNKNSVKETLHSFDKKIINFSKQKRRNKNKLAEKVIDYLWKSNSLDDEFRNEMVNKVRSYYKKTIFHPSKLLEMLDMNGGLISYQALDIIRSLETNGDKYDHNTMLPSASTIKKYCRIVDDYAATVVPFESTNLDDGSECIEFQPENVLPLLYKGYDLDDVAKTRPINIDQSIDTTQLSTRQNLTIWGLKMIDHGARNPKTGERLYGSKCYKNVQSRNHCYPLKMAMRRETKALFKLFETSFANLMKYSNNKLGDYHPINCAMDCDMSAAWKLLHMGGPMRNSKYACHLCSESVNEVGTYEGQHCDHWCLKLHEGDVDFKCRHHMFHVSFTWKTDVV
jgi:hypothetical protein